jgi:thiol:disulfide interchange protein DsbD
MRSILAFLLIVLGVLALGADAHAQNGLLPDNAPKVQAQFVPERSEVYPGETITVALHKVIQEGWHTYWLNPGDSGAPTFIEWELPEGWSTADIQWPYPMRLPFDPLMNYGYENEVALLVDITVSEDALPGETLTFPTDVGWLVCADVCIPEDATVDLSLTISDNPAPPAADTAQFFADARAKLPLNANFTSVYEADDMRFALLIENQAFVDAPPRDAVFYPYTDGIVEPPAAQDLRTVQNGLVVETAAGWEIGDPEKRPGFGEVSGVLVLTSAGGQTESFALSAIPGVVPLVVPLALADIGFLSALLFALLGGIILNLMPCVLPVLSMKALALAKKADVPAKAKFEALAYTSGVITTFLFLALLLISFRAGGSAVGWGFQLQQPIFVAGLALLMFAVGLNFAGLFEISAGRLAGAGENLTGKGGSIGSFFTGTLAVVVATPCTAPFMAAALGYASTQTAIVSLSVFLALALGFALPFLVLGFSPPVLKYLPRPGAWMDIFKQLLSFPMFGAALWLVWVLAQQTGPDGLFAVFGAGLALTFALWAYGASCKASSKSGKLGLASATVGLILMALLTARIGGSAGVQAEASGGGVLGYEPYSALRIEELRAAGTPVFVNATAAWCITCLVNEQFALSGEGLKSAFDERSVVAVKADWTNQNPETTALLAEYGRNGVPLYLYYAPNAVRAKILPQILTESIVLAALES